MEVEGNVGMASEPLRMVLVDGSLVDYKGFEGKEIVVEEVIAYGEARVLVCRRGGQGMREEGVF